MSSADATEFAKEVSELFMGRLTVALMERGRIELRGMLFGKLHRLSKHKMILRLYGPKFEEENFDEGFDFEGCVDG